MLKPTKSVEYTLSLGFAAGFVDVTLPNVYNVPISVKPACLIHKSPASILSSSLTTLSSISVFPDQDL